MPAIDEEYYIETNENYSRGLALDEYNGVFSLAACNRSDGGTIYLQWCKLMLGKDKLSEKSNPVKVELGTRFEAIEVLHRLLEMLGAEDSKLEPPTPDDTDGIPF